MSRVVRCILRLGRAIRHPRRTWARLRQRSSSPPPSPAVAVASPRRIARPLAGGFGVNLAGYLRAETGVGESVRATMRALQAAGVPLVVNDFISDGASANVEMIEPTLLTRDRPYAINVVHVNADQTRVFADLAGADYYRDRYTIGVWHWELSEFPRASQPAFDHYDEIWCQTNFVADAVAHASPVPVVRVPFAVKPRRAPRPDLDRAHFGLREDAFVFLFVFDFASYMERKNPLGVVDAFKRAFGGGRDVTLVIKANRPELDADGMQRLRDAAAGSPITLMEATLPREELDALINVCDCYVSLHRSEGIGLTLVEAMVAGKPVIATDYSGNTDFATLSNSFPVKYRLVELDRDYGPYRQGCVWAAPDLDHAAQMMRRVYEDRDLARAVGEEGRQDILRYNSAQAAGEIARARLLKIASFHGLPAPDA